MLEEAELDPTRLELLDAEEADAELSVSDSAPPLLLDTELDPARLELLGDKEAVVIAEEVVLITGDDEVVTTFPA